MLVKSIRRWWHKNGSQLIWGAVTGALALLVYYTQGAVINEILYQVSRPFNYNLTIEKERLYQDRTIQQLLNEIEQLKTTNQELQNLINYQGKNNQNFVTARVIGRNPDGWWQIITLDKGENIGVKVDSVVISVGGLVGKVIQVTPNTSRVLLISDYDSRVGANTSRTGYQGFIKGQSSQIGMMEFYAKVTDVDMGDLVTTSNLSSIFPPDIPIGKVSALHLNKSPAPEVEIEFTSPLAFLDWVMVAVD